MARFLERSQHQHRSHTIARLTTVIDSHLLPDDLQHMALYYRAKTHRDLGNSRASRAGMQAVADGQGRLAPAARRGLAHLARMAGDFPTAHTLGWEGRHHRVWLRSLPAAAFVCESGRHLTRRRVRNVHVN